MPPRLKDKVQQAQRDPQNQSRIVVEGVDTPTGQYSDRAKIDPFTRKWYYRHEVTGGPRGDISRT